jgi:hypothetical protein
MEFKNSKLSCHLLRKRMLDNRKSKKGTPTTLIRPAKAFIIARENFHIAYQV